MASCISKRMYAILPPQCHRLCYLTSRLAPGPSHERSVSLSAIEGCHVLLFERSRIFAVPLLLSTSLDGSIRAWEVQGKLCLLKWALNAQQVSLYMATRLLTAT